MDFTLNTSEGFLNTDIAIMTTGMEPESIYTLMFSDDSRVDGLSGNTIVYKKFLQAGEYEITLKCGGQMVKKTIRMIDAHKFGNGKSLGYTFFRNRNIIIQKKTTGVNVFYREMRKTLPLPYRPDDFFEIDSGRIVFILKDGINIVKAGIFDIGKGVMVEEEDTKGGFIVPFLRILCYYTDDHIYVIVDGRSLAIDGKFILKHCSYRGIFYQREDSMIYLEFDPFCSTVIGPFTCSWTTSAPNLFILEGPERRILWNSVLKKEIYQNPSLNFSFMDDDSFIEASVKRPYYLYGPDGQYECALDNPLDIKSINGNRHRIFIYPRSFHLVSTRTYPGTNGTLFPYEFLATFLDDLIHYKTSEGVYILYSVSNDVSLEIDIRLMHHLVLSGKNILVARADSQSRFYELVDNELKLLASYEGEYPYIGEFDRLLVNTGRIWLKTGYNNLIAFTAFTDEKACGFYYLNRFGEWYQKDDHTVINIKSLQETTVFGENIELLREDASEALVVRTDGTYLISSDPEVADQLIFDADIFYEKADILPDGKMIVLCDKENTVLQPLELGEPITLEKTEFVEIDDGKVIVRDEHGYSQVKIIDQSSYELVQNTHTDYTRYTFTNVRGSLRSNSWGNKNRKHDEIVISDMENKSVYHIPIRTRPDYINYISFSHDDAYVAICGKLLDQREGIMEILALNRDNNGLSGSTTSVDKTYYAVWKVIFSPNRDLIAFYDSLPTAYVYNLNDKGVAFSRYSRSNRSVECFSPDGQYLVLGQNRYEATSIGGRGWCPSNKVFLTLAADGTEIKEFCEHSAQLVYANISREGNKMITRSEDGIVVVRSI